MNRTEANLRKYQIASKSQLEKALNEGHFLVEQESTCCECFPGCEEPNLYIVYSSQKDHTEKGAQVCRMVELFEDDFDMRCYCCLRGYYAELRDNKSDRVAIGKTKFRPPCYLCCPLFGVLDICQPVMELRGEDNEVRLGEVVYPLWCCFLPAPSCRGLCSAMELDINDDAGSTRFRITAPSFNPGFLCGMLGGVMRMCERRIYIIEDPEGKPVGRIINIYKGSYEECCTKGDRFAVEFPLSSTFEDKQRILLSVFFIDFLQYNA